jgi:hypothetical protein
MMSVLPEGAEGLAEIFREIFALSETNSRNHSQSAAADDSITLLEGQCANEIRQTCGPHRKQASEARGEREDHHEARARGDSNTRPTD